MVCGNDTDNNLPTYCENSENQVKQWSVKRLLSKTSNLILMSSKANISCDHLHSSTEPELCWANFHVVS